jgi:XTP/dITP diphosphohydrolase
MQESNELWFATSNIHKFHEAKFVLRETNLRLRRIPSKGTEVQSDDVEEIAKTAAAETFMNHRRPLFVEDTGLSIESLNGFPGAFAAYVYRTIGPDGIIRLMESARSRMAEFVSVVAYCEESPSPRLFAGRLKGRIATELKGSGGFGFDSIFIPEGRRRTLAEMSMAEKCALSHRSLALRALASWLVARQRG